LRTVPCRTFTSPFAGDLMPARRRERSSSRFGNLESATTCVSSSLISILAFAALLSFGAAQSSQRGPGLDDISAFVDDDIEHIDTWLQGLTDSFYPSLSAVVVRDGEIVYQGTFGLEDIESRQPATARTQYHVASVTKVFTASLAAMLHEQGSALSGHAWLL